MIKYKRILLKLSGEALLGNQQYGIDNEFLNVYAEEIVEVSELGVQVAIVIGGGNIYRGVEGIGAGMDRAQSDNMGMLATVINGLALQEVLEKKGLFTRLQSAIEIKKVCEAFILRKAIRHLDKGRIVIFAAGTGNPYFTTDTAAALRALEIKADILLKATRVDGIYTADPEIDHNAKKYNTITFNEILQNELKVMDMTSFTLSEENRLPIIVFNVNNKGALLKIVKGETIGTLVN